MCDQKFATLFIKLNDWSGGGRGDFLQDYAFVRFWILRFQQLCPIL